MSIWADHIDELENLMSEILIQRLRSGEELDMTEEEIVDAMSLSTFIRDREGEDYLFEVMDEAMQTFIDRMMDAAEASMELQKDFEAERKV